MPLSVTRAELRTSEFRKERGIKGSEGFTARGLENKKKVRGMRDVWRGSGVARASLCGAPGAVSVYLGPRRTGDGPRGHKCALDVGMIEI